MGKIENAMTRQCNHHKPERPLESDDCDGKKEHANQRLEHQCMRGSTHNRKEHVVGCDDNRDYGIEGSVPIQADASGKQAYGECKYSSDE